MLTALGIGALLHPSLQVVFQPLPLLVRTRQRHDAGNDGADTTGAEDQLKEAAALVKGSRDNVLDKLSGLIERNRQLEKELEQLKAKAASAAGNDLAGSAVDVKGVKVLAARLDGLDGKALLALVDQLKNKLGSAVILLGGVFDDKVVLVAGVTQDLTAKLKAGDLMRQAAAAVGGKGGGRPDMAQGGGVDAGKLDEALALAATFVEQGA